MTYDQLTALSDAWQDALKFPDSNERFKSATGYVIVNEFHNYVIAHRGLSTIKLLNNGDIFEL